MEQRAGRGVEPLPDQFGQGVAVARCRNNVGEAHAFGRGGRGVADREDRLAALLARFCERPHAVGAGDQDRLACRERRREIGRRMQHLQAEQRRDHRLVAARGERLGQCRRLAFRPGDQHAHDVLCLSFSSPPPEGEA
jgi:hypothetical protein